jgi:hypothetical protein
MSEDEIGQMIEDCEKRSGKINDWELEFIDSISRSYAKYSSLTIRQQEMLEKIWNRITE